MAHKNAHVFLISDKREPVKHVADNFVDRGFVVVFSRYLQNGVCLCVHAGKRVVYEPTVRYSTEFQTKYAEIGF